MITGNLMMPGFTAPKLLWVQRHEPEIFRQIDKVLLPKDYLRLRMTGEFASDMSDAAGTMWLDVAKRDWSDVMLQACDLSRDQMPALYEGSEITGALLPEVAKAWGMATCQLSQAVATMQLVQLVWEWLMLIRQCYRWGRRGSILLSAKGS